MLAPFLCPKASPTTKQLFRASPAWKHPRRWSSSATKQGYLFTPKPVPQVFLEDLDSENLYDKLVRSPQQAASPIHFIPKTSHKNHDVVDLLLKDPASQDCIVTLEVGRYDKDVELVQLPLAYYLEWLRDGKEGGLMNGKQVYLAQWRGLEDIPSLQRFLHPPDSLQALFDASRADLYQASFFIGPTGATTPLHYDPYINLFRLASGNSETASKHFLIIPPSLSTYLTRDKHEGHLRNTSPLEFEVDHTTGDITLSPDSPSQSKAKEIGQEAFGVRLRPGEMLLLPERWWHRVENIGDRAGWTAGVGYWFLTRKTATKDKKVLPDP